MSRLDEFKKSEKVRIDELLTSEIQIRANAARELAEPFEIDGVEIEIGTRNGTIIIHAGIERLAELVNCEITETIETFAGKKYRVKAFEYGGTKFEYCDWHEVKECDNDESV